MQRVPRRAQLLLIRAVAALLGGAGPSYRPAALAGALLQAHQLVQGLQEWLPVPYHDLLSLQPEADVLRQRVLGLRGEEQQGGEGGGQRGGSGRVEASSDGAAGTAPLSEEELAAIASAPDEDVPCLEALYTTGERGEPCAHSGNAETSAICARRRLPRAPLPRRGPQGAADRGAVAAGDCH